jgi:hypothetical protein
MDPDKRKATLEKLADHYEVSPSDPSTAGEDLKAYLDDPKTIRRWVAVTRSDQFDIHYLVADFDDEAAAREHAVRFVEDPLFAELPVLVFDLDRGRGIRCGVDVAWTEEVMCFDGAEAALVAAAEADAAPEGGEKVDETDAVAYVREAMRGRLEDLRLLQRLGNGEGKDVLREGLGDEVEGLGVELEGGEPLEDQALDRLGEYPLCVEATTTFEVILGTGGPDDRILVECDGGRETYLGGQGYEIRRILYRYSWDGSAERELSGEDYDLAEHLARRVVPELVE